MAGLEVDRQFQSQEQKLEPRNQSMRTQVSAWGEVDAIHQAAYLAEIDCRSTGRSQRIPLPQSKTWAICSMGSLLHPQAMRSNMDF